MPLSRELAAMVAAGLLSPEQAALVQAAQNGSQARNEPARSLEDTIAIVLAAQLAADLEGVLDDIEAGREPDTDHLAEGLALLLIPLLMRAAIAATLREAAIMGVDVDMALVNAAALEWATQYSAELVKGLTVTTQAAIDEAMQTYREHPGMNRAGLAALLAFAFGMGRAAMIAATEVTRGYTAGVGVYQHLLARQRVPTVRIWDTAADERVCVVCLPMDGLAERYWEPKSGPPAHVRCRCQTHLEVRRHDKH
jgi:hypothetical protein